MGVSNASPDSDRDLVRRFEAPDRSAMSGFIVDYFGSRIDPAFLPAPYSTSEPLGLPMPSDGILHEFLEYLGTAVALALAPDDRITVMELGAGFGPWIVRAALIARRLKIHHVCLVGVEADPRHFKWMQEHLRNNELIPTESQDLSAEILNCAVSERQRWLYFPDLQQNQNDWGAAASTQCHPTDYRGFSLKSRKVPAMPIQTLLGRHTRVDLLHVDIQGSEFGVVRAGLRDLNSKVRVMVVGTHSRKIEGDLIDLLFKNGWNLRNEKPCNFEYKSDAPSLEGMTSVDGTQIWVNPRL